VASYAFSWVTGSEQHVGRLSIGIGTGDPDGGTIHAVLFPTRPAMAFRSPTSGSTRYPRVART